MKGKVVEFQINSLDYEVSHYQEQFMGAILTQICVFRREDFTFGCSKCDF